MNRLILIGNGFDLAHGLKTSYGDFITSYFKKAIIETYTRNDQIYPNNELINLAIKPNSSITDNQISKVESIKTYNELINEFKPFLNFSGSSDFMIDVLEKSEKGWVDIEGSYFSHLKKVFKRYQIAEENGVNEPSGVLKKLNNQLEYLKNELIKYLDSKTKKHSLKYDNELLNIFISLFQGNENPPENIYFLNFNYTNTLDFYKDHIRLNSSNIVVNNIHGSISKSNEVIFGYGGNSDAIYREILKNPEYEFNRHLKINLYDKKFNDLNSFINRGEFDLFILGHSLEESDRGILNLIIDNPNRKKIKLFHRAEKQIEGFRIKRNRLYANSDKDEREILSFLNEYSERDIIPQVKK